MELNGSLKISLKSATVAHFTKAQYYICKCNIELY